MSGKPPILRNLEGQSYKHLKREIKWTPLKIVITTVLIGVPYVVFLIFVSSISKVLLGLLIGIPLVVFSILYLMHILTKDL
ncbi:putative membrane protein [Lyngbya aestuarii BL J]|uniref:Putative membrane protein n=1 Tax=Lyngbya aestuarii BL J TaxID=1348334 RepID=U7QD49_9CYAN|nr:hypothetical protein [Lyngbya aestuarii]ERT04905.1 putative membrane protein [Lyngbya aestuarii BL J]